MNFPWQREVCGKLERGCHFVSCLECHLTPLSDAPEELCFKMRVIVCHILATSQPAADWSPGRVDGGLVPRLWSVSPAVCPFSAGVTMKLMDEVAGIVAARHCKTNIVTASVDAINFHDKIRKGKHSPCENEGGSFLEFLVPLHSVLTPAVCLCSTKAGRQSCALPSHTPVRLVFTDLTGMTEASSVPALWY